MIQTKKLPGAKGLLCIAICIIVFFSCGISSEDREKIRLQEMAQRDYAMKMFKSHLAEEEEYEKAVMALKDSLESPHDTAFVFEGKLSPALEIDGDNSNMLCLEFNLKGDSIIDNFDSDIIRYSLRNDAQQAYEFYHKLKTDTSEHGESISYYDSLKIERISGLLNAKNTPYVLILKKLFQTKVEVFSDKNSYSGGEILGYMWLADMRQSKILGSMMFVASPSSVTVKEKDPDFMAESAIKESARNEATRLIRDWLEKFKNKM